MNPMLAQDVPAFSGDAKAWLISITGVISAMVIGRLIQAFRNGAGLKDAFMSVWLGTNSPKPADGSSAFPPAPPSTPTSKTSVYLLIGLLALGSLAGTACKSTPQQVTYQAASATTVTVEVALRAYNVFSAQGKTTVDQNRQVKAAYEKYQAAFAVVCDAGQIYAATGGTNAPAASLAMQAAVANASASQTDIIKLIQSFGVKL